MKYLIGCMQQVELCGLKMGMVDFFYSAGETVRYVGVVGGVWMGLECNVTCGS